MSAPSSSNLSVITVTSYRLKIWLLYLFLHNMGASMSKQQRGGLLNECSFGLFGFQFDE